MNINRHREEIMSYIELKDVKKIYKMGEVNINALSGVNFSVEKENL